MRRSPGPDAVLLESPQTTHDAAANRTHWDPRRPRRRRQQRLNPAREQASSPADLSRLTDSSRLYNVSRLPRQLVLGRKRWRRARQTPATAPPPPAGPEGQILLLRRISGRSGRRCLRSREPEANARKGIVHELLRLWKTKCRRHIVLRVLRSEPSHEFQSRGSCRSSLSSCPVCAFIRAWSWANEQVDTPLLLAR
jgi:hypothetical protein